MYLKSLTLRGFKSFASSTTLRFEPGITCVVGPNGSGKSNVVDALAWVMGEQGAKSLRGGKMEDVVFAGAASRGPLGRAEVILTIDNSDGALPIDYTEVTIGRLMFRSGHSEYAINGDPCRLLDIQELLSDSGIGHQMHVVVGQGHLDDVLYANPEGRRALIEEAAGVLKHRKRKEKALRKLEAMQANLVRLTDLTAELRRQLKPLGKQAEIARKAAVIQAQLRDARLRLLADDVVALSAQLAKEEADEAAVRAHRAAVENQLAQARQRQDELEAAANDAAPRLARAQETYYRLMSLRERLRGVANLATERHRHATAELGEERHGRDPQELEREAAQARQLQAELVAQLEAARGTLAQAVQARAKAEAALQAEERRLAAAARAAADHREGLARMRGQISALRSHADAAREEIDRLRAALDEASARAERAHGEHAALAAEAADAEAAEDLENAQHAATTALDGIQRRLTKARAEEREAERERAALVARKEALQLSIARDDAVQLLLTLNGELPGVLGAASVLLEVEPGAEVAVAAALGGAADAVAVSSVDAATRALALLKEKEAGRAALLVGNAPEPRCERPTLPHGARYAADLVTAPTVLLPAIRRLLDGVAVVDDLTAARALVSASPQLIAVTRDGDVVGGHLAHGGSASVASRLELQAAVDETTERLMAAELRGAVAARALAEATEAEQAAKATVDRLATRRSEVDQRNATLAQRLGVLAGAARAAEEEAERLTVAMAAAELARQHDLTRLAQLEERLSAAGSAPADRSGQRADCRDRLADQCVAARSGETEARLAVRTAEERLCAVTDRADALEAAAATERVAREQAAVACARRKRQALVAGAIAGGAQAACARIEASVAAAITEREQAEQGRTVIEAELKTVRTRIRELSADLDQLVSRTHGTELARAEQRLRLEQLESKAVQEFGVQVSALIAEYGPDQPVPPADGDAVAVPYDRTQQETRARAAERQLALLGKVNPLALEEYGALEERHAFLTSQLEDLKKTRRDLLTVVREVDERVEQAFTAAYQDTAHEFDQVFAQLFPGGEGRLLLTDPNDMLTTGVEVEARPPGKRVKRLSLLSGGERSLVAIAFLLALFKARPSPFYVLDEVEAALDDINLQRLLRIFAELRQTSQLIIVTHQKRTMEAADTLYGISMRSDGVSTVVSQRLRERELA